MKILLLLCSLCLTIKWQPGNAAVVNKDSGKDGGNSLDLGGNEGQIQGKGKFKTKLSPCAGPYNDCCTYDPDQDQNPDTTFIYPSYLGQYFYVCVENNLGDLEPTFFRCPYQIDDEGYHEGLFNADDAVGCYLAPPEVQRKKKTRVDSGSATG